ncbi:MAG: MBL fold metallo-hydrolase [Ardenticatenales bacterium]|nr:MBL fold metallo-hydrolase [Ardenticatenales bacterium]
MTPTLLFLGTSDSKGVPRLGCECALCQSVRPSARDFRTRASLLLQATEGTILIDTPPEVRLRLAAEHRPAPDALFMTHPHDDHILGFSDVVRSARTMQRPLPIFAPAEVFTGLRDRFGYLWESPTWSQEAELTVLEGAIEVAGWRLEAIRVHHGRNGWAYGYLMERSGWRAGYFSDALHVSDEVLGRWQGLDLLILGANFWKEEAPLETRSVYDVQEAITVAQGASVRQLILTHLSHKIEYATISPLLPSWASLAWDGRLIQISPIERTNPDEADGTNSTSSPDALYP